MSGFKSREDVEKKPKSERHIFFGKNILGRKMTGTWDTDESVLLVFAPATFIYIHVLGTRQGCVDHKHRQEVMLQYTTMTTE